MSIGHPCCHCALFYIYYLVGNAQSELDEYVRLAKERDKLFQRSIENTFKFQSIRYFFWNYNTNHFLSVKESKRFFHPNIAFAYPALVEPLPKQNLRWAFAYFSSLADDAGFKRIICSHKLYIHSLLPILLRGGSDCGRGGKEP